jgi:4-diphosphocytidyl-2-C-methyl-D-erythritol kinase
MPLHDSAQRLGRMPIVQWPAIIEAAANDFETPVYDAHPVLSEIKAGLIAAGAEMALLSGSGATVFGVFRDEASAAQARALLGDAGRKVFLVETCRQPLVCR